MDVDKERDAYWELYIKPLCRPEISSREEYEQLTEIGQLRAQELLKLLPHPFRSESTLLTIHREIFSDVYEWAGTYRQEEHLVAFGPPRGLDPHEREFSGAHAPMISEEVNTLSEQLKALLRMDDSTERKAQAIAFYSTKLHLIHPFRDGNSRVSMTVTRFLAGRLLPEVKPPAPEVKLYYQVRTLAQQEAFVRPFAQHVLGVRLPDKLSNAPHSMEVSPHLVTLPLQSNLYASVVCYDAADTRLWKRTLSSLREAGELTPLRDGEHKLFHPLDKVQLTNVREQNKAKPVLAHKVLSDREKLLAWPPPKTHSDKLGPSLTRPTIEYTTKDKRGLGLDL